MNFIDAPNSVTREKETTIFHLLNNQTLTPSPYYDINPTNNIYCHGSKGNEKLAARRHTHTCHLFYILFIGVNTTIY
jgi:hypothetical protein